MNISTDSDWLSRGLTALKRITVALAVGLCLLAGGARHAAATPFIYQFTAGTYTGWITYDPATVIEDTNYTTPTSAVYRGPSLVSMSETLTDGTNYNTFDVAAVVLYNAAGYYGFVFSGLSQWGYVEQDLLYYGAYQPLTSTALPGPIDQTGLSLFVYIGGVRATDANLQLHSTITETNVAPPVPEPSSLMVMGLGLLGLAGLSARRRMPALRIMKFQH